MPYLGWKWPDPAHGKSKHGEAVRRDGHALVQSEILGDVSASGELAELAGRLAIAEYEDWVALKGRLDSDFERYCLSLAPGPVDNVMNWPLKATAELIRPWAARDPSLFLLPYVRQQAKLRVQLKLQGASDSRSCNERARDLASILWSIVDEANQCLGGTFASVWFADTRRWSKPHAWVYVLCAYAETETIFREAHLYDGWFGLKRLVWQDGVR